ncbi:MAG: hypothetical protein FD127_4373, partial [Acidimicrobiaceae bacterium]
IDAATNESGHSNQASATTPAVPDTDPPTAPINLTAQATSSTAIDLDWTASTDNVAVTGYRVFRDGSLIATVGSLDYTDSDLCPNTTYGYHVTAVDAAANESAPSNTAIETTPFPEINLGSCEPFGILAGVSVGVTGLVATVVNGNLGISPGNSLLGGLLLTVTGSTHLGNATAAQAQVDLTLGYNQLLDAVVCDDNVLGGQNLGGLTLTAGVYSSSGGSLNGTLTLDAQGDPNAIFIIKSTGGLNVATSAEVNLANGAQAENVWWVVPGSLTIGASADVCGSYLVNSDATLGLLAAVHGRVLVRQGSVNMLVNTIGF